MAVGLEQPPRELSPEEAAAAVDRDTYRYEDDELVELNLVRDGELRYVRYFDRAWPDPALLAAHRRAHGDVPFEVSGAVRDGRRRRWSVVGGELGEYVEDELDERGEPLSESRYSPHGELLERTEFIYDDGGELVRVLELNPDGSVASERDWW